MLELYHWEPVGDSAKLLILMEEKGLDYKSHYVDVLNFEQYNAEHLTRSAMARVPVLAAGENLDLARLTMDYLVEAYSPRLAAEDALGWYNTQAWANILDAGLLTNVSLLGWNTVTLAAMEGAEREAFSRRYAERPVKERQAGWSAVFSDAEADEDQLENARERIRDSVKRIEAGLQESGWLVGAEYSVADINAYALCRTLPRLTPEIVNESDTPRMLEWLSRIEQRPAVAKVLAMSRSGGDIYAPPG